MFKHVVCIVFILLSNISFGQDNNLSLQSELEEAIESENLTGAVWSMVSDSIVSVGATGLKNAQSKEQLKVDDKVLIGSVTKTLIATGMLRLASQGKVDLDAPTQESLKDIAFDNAWQETDPVTIRDLLNHTAGLEDARLWQVFSTESEPNTPLEYLFAKDPSVLRIHSRPGTRFSYSNMGYSMMGLIIERITKEPYENYLDRNLLQPLGMTNSTFQFTTQVGVQRDDQLAMGHFDDWRTQENLPMYLRPAGQFTTTASDMALLAKFLMSDGTINGKQFVKADLLRQMGKPTSTESNVNGLNSGYQFGLSYRDRYGVIGYFHRGNIIGYRATFYLFPEQQKAFFISFNTDSETADYQKFNEIFIKHLKIVRPEKIAARNHLPRDISKYEGFYQMKPVRFSQFAYLDLLFNFITVKHSDKELVVNSIQQDAYSLLPVEENLYRKVDRVRVSHVLYEVDKTKAISDGLVTYEKLNALYLGLMWLSLVLGLLGIIMVLIRGIYLLSQNELFKTYQIIRVPFLSLVLLVLPFPFLLNQPFLNLGDLTFPNVLLAIVTSALPLAMVFGIYKAMVGKSLKIDLISVVFILQWTIVLAYWDMLPFRLWG